MQGHIQRHLLASVRAYLDQFPAVAILGPRQCGKSTLARMLLAEQPETLYLDLERPSDLRKLSQPELYFAAHQSHLVCLDEIRRAPELFPVLRSVLDETGRPGQMLLLGSASGELIRQSSESLAGRIGYLELTPFLLDEVRDLEPGFSSLRRLWLRGGFPRSYLAETDAQSLAWRFQFVRTFLERDLPQLGISTPAATLRRFWEMCAHVHGQLLNYSQLGVALGVSHTTVRHYLDLLVQTFVIRALPPYAANASKRLVKSPKLYLRDTGLLHALLGLETMDELFGHPAFGSSWEGFVLENVLAHLNEGWRTSFYRTSAGAELDLVLERGSRRLAIECKASAAPTLTRGFWNAMEDLSIERAWVIAPVEGSYPISPAVSVTGLDAFLFVELPGLIRR